MTGPGGERLLALHDELDRLRGTAGAGPQAVVLLVAAVILVLLGFDAGPGWLVPGGVVAGALGLAFVARDARRALRKRSLAREIRVREATPLPSPSDVDRADR